MPIDFSDISSDVFADAVIEAICEAESLGLVQSVICADGERRYIFNQRALDYVVAYLTEDKTLGH